MADSDNSMTLPCVTRRKLLAGSAIAVGALNSDAFARNEIKRDAPFDPVVPLWHQWRGAHKLTERLRSQQQSLERQLAEIVGFPFATIHLSDGEPLAAYSREAIHEVFRLAPQQTAACAKAEAEFAAHQLRWDRADREIGYSAAVQAEREAGALAENLLHAIATTSATTLSGVAAKLDAVLHEGNIWEDGSEFPWPHIRSALNDIRRLEKSFAKDGAL